MSNWVERWSVESKSKADKYYTVCRDADGSFGCSCPHWVFRKQTCKHIEYVVKTIFELTPTETATVNKMRFISKINGIKLSCNNCKHVDSINPFGRCIKLFKENQFKLFFTEHEKKPFYILGRCCVDYEKV